MLRVSPATSPWSPRPLRASPLPRPPSPATQTSSTVNAVVGQTIANGLDVPLDGSGNLDLIWVGKTASVANLQLDITGFWK